jgi:sugar lactone lactonase YvrE
MRARSVLSIAAVAAFLAVPAGAQTFPKVIDLPVGWQPEGIASGKGNSIYVGSIPTGRIWRGDVRTGRGAPVVTPPAGRAAIGIKVDNRNRIFVAGGPTGNAWVYRAGNGATLATYQLATSEPRFVNDVVVTRQAAWFTNSNAAELYRVPIGPGGRLGAQSSVRTVTLRGDYTQADGFNVNGIDATPNGRTLIIVQSNLGRLYKVNAATGVADRIELTGGDVMNGDGILLHGRTLYVVQNQLNRVAVVRLSPNLGSGRIVRHLTEAADVLDVPTTIARKGSRLYVVNARFGTENPEAAEYTVVRLGGR